MKVSSSPKSEPDQIAAPYHLHVFDMLPDLEFNNIALLAAQICNTSISVISFTDNTRSLFKAKSGVNLTEISLDDAFYVNDLTKEDDILIIEDTFSNKFIFDNPLVTGYPNIRFFAGIPLIDKDRYAVGHLFVADNKPRDLSHQQLSGLKMLGKQAEALLNLQLQVADLEKADEASRNSEEQMNTIFVNAIDAVIMMDDKGVIVQWNPKAETIFGWKAKEAIGKYVHETIVPERHRVAHLKRMKRYEHPDEPIINKTIEITALRKDNTEFDIALGVSPTVINGNRFFINFISDITDRKLATNKLDKQKEFYESILNSLPTDIAVFDPNHTYLFVNPGAIKDEEFRKYIVGKDDFQYCEYRKRDRSIAQKRRDQFLEVKKAGKEIRWEDTIRDAEGNPITHLRRLFPVHDDRGELTMVIGFGIDITDRKIMEEKQTAIMKQVSAQNVQLIDFCNIVSHNLRAPLVNMGMLVKFIEESKDEEEQKLLISKLEPVIDHLNTTFNELVESIQIKQDLEIKYENMLLADCLQRTIEGLKTEISNSKAVIEADFSLAPKIYCPSKYLFSIFHNLVSNTLKYQSPKRTPHIELKTERINDTIILSVKDNGLGIDLEKHKENFFKIGKVFHRHPDAKGFGLFMTKTQVEAMNGNIWVDSTPDEGSTFYVEFKNQDR